MDSKVPDPERRAGRGSGVKWGVALASAAAVMGTGIGAFVLASRGSGVAPRISASATPSGQAAALPGALAPAGGGGMIVFASSHEGPYHIHVINPDGTGETALTSGKGEETTPAWSPDRRRIAFAGSLKARTSSAIVADIYIIEADGTGLIRLTDTPEHEEDPSWSPDGTRIVFTASDRSKGRTRIRIAAVDGSEVSQLPAPPAGCLDREPAWSPDGLTIAFARKCGTEPSALFLIRADGTGLQQLDGFGRTPDWSPDGSKLAYTGWGRQGPAIFVVNADGTGKLQVTTDGSGDPVWSPDGGRFAFTVHGLSGLTLFVINVDGTDQRPLTHGTSNELMPSW